MEQRENIEFNQNTVLTLFKTQTSIFIHLNLIQQKTNLKKNGIKEFYLQLFHTS